MLHNSVQHLCSKTESEGWPQKLCSDLYVNKAFRILWLMTEMHEKGLMQEIPDVFPEYFSQPFLYYFLSCML